MYDLVVESFDINFISIRERMGKFVLYVGKNDGNLYSHILPVSSIKNYHIAIPLSPDHEDVDVCDVYMPLTIVDKDNKAHIFLYKTPLWEEGTELINHFIFDDIDYDRAFIATDPISILFAGEGKDDKLYVKAISDLTLYTDCLSDIDESVFEDLEIVKNVKKDTIRLVFHSGHGREHYASYLYFIKDNKPYYYLMDRDFMLPIDKEQIKTKTGDLLLSSRSKHIQVHSFGIPVIAGDNQLYFINEIEEKETCIPHMPYIEIVDFTEYPHGIKAEDIHKIMVKGHIKDMLSGGLIRKDDCALLLLTKQGELWVKGKNFDNIIDDHEDVVTDWKLLQKNVDDILQMRQVAPNVLIKTKNGKLYYRGFSERDSYLKDSFLRDNFDKIPLLPFMDKNTGLVEKHIKAFIGSASFPKANVAFYWNSFFIDENDRYIKSRTRVKTDKGSIISLWEGDLFKMEDVLYENITNPLSLLNYVC